MKKLLFFFILMLSPMLANAVENQQELLYGEWRLVGWYDGGIWFEVDTNYVSHRHMSIEIKDKEEGYTMAYSRVNEIFVGLLTLNGNEMIFSGEYKGVHTMVLWGSKENLFFEDHICNIKSYQLEGKQLRLYYTDDDYFVFTKVFDGSEETQKDQEEPNDYLPFVDMGKQWNVVCTVVNPNSSCHFERYGISEEIERDGKTYFRVLQSEDNLTVMHDAGLYREENRRVYKYDEMAGRDVMLYDFSLKEGDTFTYEMGVDNPVNCKVLKLGWLDDGPIIESLNNSTDTLYRHRYLRTWTIGRDNGSGKYDEIATWVECVGALENMFSPLFASGKRSRLAYIDYRHDMGGENAYLPFSLCDIYDVRGQIHGCDMPTGAADNMESEDWHHRLTYELEGNRLHVYGKIFCCCAGSHYIYFFEEQTDDPLVHKLHFEIRNLADAMACQAHHPTDFYVSGFDPNLNYIVVDDQGVEHPVINKTPQNEYRPFVEEGKVWKVGTGTTIVDNSVQVVDYYYFDGDTIIGGKTCKQMMCQRYVSPNYSNEYWTPRPSLTKVGAWYEEDKKVYSFDERQQTMTLKYDFSLEANDTLHFLNVDDFPPFIIGPKQTGGIEGFKGVYRDIMMCRDEGQNIRNTTWLEGVGVRDAPFRNAYDPRADLVPEFLISCTVGDEIIYLNDRYEDEATPESMGARKNRFDFTHTIKTKPKARKRSEEEPLLYGEYNNLKLGINLNPLDDAYQVRITDDSGKIVYTVENSEESFTGEFYAQTTGIVEVINKTKEVRSNIYNLQGQRLSSLQKGLNIVNGQKIFVK